MINILIIECKYSLEMWLRLLNKETEVHMPKINPVFMN